MLVLVTSVQTLHTIVTFCLISRELVVIYVRHSVHDLHCVVWEALIYPYGTFLGVDFDDVDSV